MRCTVSMKGAFRYRPGSVRMFWTLPNRVSRPYSFWSIW